MAKMPRRRLTLRDAVARFMEAGRVVVFGDTMRIKLEIDASQAIAALDEAQRKANALAGAFERVNEEAERMSGGDDDV